MTRRRWNLSDVEITHFKGSGPGGQNRNKRMTGVRVVHLPTGIRAEATERRSQNQNLEAALERLDAKIEKLFEKVIPRVATKKTRSSQKRRVEAKLRRSSIKQRRGKVGRDDF